MPQWVCESCGNTFKRNRSGARPIRFCSQGCYHLATEPWNKGTHGVCRGSSTSFRKGERHGRATEFHKGLTPGNHLPVGSVTTRKCKHGSVRAFVKIAEPSVWKLRAVKVWEDAHGQLPSGLVVHHRDGDCLNDALENLSAITRTEHVNAHRRELERAKAVKRLSAGWTVDFTARLQKPRQGDLGI